MTSRRKSVSDFKKDFEMVATWAEVVFPGNIIFVGRDKDNQPIWAEVLESETTGHGLCEEILTIRYRLLDTGVKGGGRVLCRG